jgi:hypothetical protein
VHEVVQCGRVVWYPSISTVLTIRYGTVSTVLEGPGAIGRAEDQMTFVLHLHLELIVPSSTLLAD